MKEDITSIIYRTIREKEESYNQICELGDIIINDTKELEKLKGKPFEISLFLAFHKIFYEYPINCEKTEEEIKGESLQENKEDYINQVIYEIKNSEIESTPNIEILKILKAEIERKNSKKLILKKED